MMRLAAVMIASTTALAFLAACGGGSGSSEERKAIEAVDSRFGPQAEVEPKLGDQDCEIPEGGPGPRNLIPGVCSWEVQEESAGWIVSFVQTWSCEDFSAIIGTLRHCTEERGMTTWRYRVDEKGRVTYLDADGDFPPQMVE